MIRPRSPMIGRALWLALVIGLALGIVYLVASGSGTPPAPAPVPPGSFAFALLGDAPYSGGEERRFRRVLAELDADDLAWAIHVGDIFWYPCSDEMYRERLGWFEARRHPLIYTPGDNEWTDCAGKLEGGFVPLGRLARIRELFFAEPTRSLGARKLTLETQGGEFVENARWERESIVFTTVHLVGSANGWRGDAPSEDAESLRRTAAAAAWLREAFARARERGAHAVFVAFHADLNLDLPADARGRAPWEPFIVALEEEAETFPGRVVIAHGDDHEYKVDRPLVSRTTGKVLDNVTRVEVPGSPDVGWVRVVVTPGAEHPFGFALRLVPRWKLG